MLGDGKDNALLRVTLGRAFIKHGKFTEAIEHLAMATELEPDYLAAWKLYAHALSKSDKVNEAKVAYEQAIVLAGRKGDAQSKKEMKIILNELQL